MNKNQIYDLAIKTYGSKSQIHKAVEELNELASSLMQYTFNKKRDEYIEEIADVEIMLEQLKIIFRSNKKKIETYKARKLEFLEKRLKLKPIK